jgi:hypothetical protein
MEYVTPRKVTNGSTTGNGAACGFAAIVASCIERGTVGSSVSCWVRPDVTLRGPTGQVNQSRVVSMQLGVERQNVGGRYRQSPLAAARDAGVLPFL